MKETLEKFYQALDLQYSQGDLDQIERFLLESAAQMNEDAAERVGEQIAVYNELGSFYRGISRYENSISAFRLAEELAEKEMGEKSTQYATVLNNMAGTYRLMGKYEEAIGLFQKSVQIYRLNGEQQTYAYASVLNNMALVYRETKQLKTAIEYLEEALSIIETMPQCQQEVAVTYNNLTALYHAAGDTEKAKKCVELAIREFEKCADVENVHYAAGLNSFAGFLYADGAYEEALALYQKSAEYTKRFFGENIEYGVTCQNMYWVYEKTGQWKEAIAALQQAKQTFQRLLGEKHERTRAVADDLKRLKEVYCT
ncbi:MAG: tetratricopeptide repeat protein [Eubacteriales bacterium]|nr:tetratricopeptide repeat protein [Eubacteriales bacterium]